MSWWNKSQVVEAEPVQEENAFALAERRLLEVEREREQVEEEFNETFRALAAHDELRKKLAAEQSRIAGRRAALLEERGNLLRRLGRIR